MTLEIIIAWPTDIRGRDFVELYVSTASSSGLTVDAVDAVDAVSAPYEEVLFPISPQHSPRLYSHWHLQTLDLAFLRGFLLRSRICISPSHFRWRWHGCYPEFRTQTLIMYIDGPTSDVCR